MNKMISGLMIVGLVTSSWAVNTGDLANIKPYGIKKVHFDRQGEKIEMVTQMVIYNGTQKTVLLKDAAFKLSLSALNERDGEYQGYAPCIGHECTCKGIEPCAEVMLSPEQIDRMIRNANIKDENDPDDPDVIKKLDNIGFFTWIESQKFERTRKGILLEKGKVLAEIERMKKMMLNKIDNREVDLAKSEVSINAADIEWKTRAPHIPVGDWEETDTFGTKVLPLGTGRLAGHSEGNRPRPMVLPAGLSLHCVRSDFAENNSEGIAKMLEVVNAFGDPDYSIYMTMNAMADAGHYRVPGEERSGAIYSTNLDMVDLRMKAAEKGFEKYDDAMHEKIGRLLFVVRDEKKGE